MVKIKKSTIKRIVYLLIVVGIVWGGYAMLSGPEYDDPGTPKPTFGNENAAVEVVEFGDIQCPACKSAQPTVERIKEEYGDRISFRFYHFPLSAIHPYAQDAAEAVECANDQGMFWEYLDAAYRISPNLQKSSLKQLADTLDLNMEKFNACLESNAKYRTVQGDYKYGQAQGVQGTPTFFINGQKLENWNYESFSTAIEAELGE